MLFKFLLKDDEVRLSDFGRDQLKQEQINYAVFDAIASFYVAEALKLKEVIHRIPTMNEFVVGCYVRLFTKSGATVVGVGRITEVFPQEKCKVKLLDIYKKLTKLFANPFDKDKKLGDFKHGDGVEWIRYATRKASEEEIQSLSGKAETCEATIAVEPEVGSIGTQPSNVKADLGVRPTTVEATAESVPLPEGVDLNEYPDSHEEEQPGERVRPSRSCARNAGGRHVIPGISSASHIHDSSTKTARVPRTDQTCTHIPATRRE